MSRTFTARPDTICELHWDELVRGSAISPAIAKANFQSLNDSDDILERLAGAELGNLKGHAQQYATGAVKKIYRRYETVVRGGWWVSGLDPLNDLARMGWGQFKADSPRQGWTRVEQGNLHSTVKVIKYEAPAKTPQRAFFGAGFDWPKILADPSIPIAITEGAKKAACLLSLGVAAIALTGVDGWSLRDEANNRQLLPELKLFCHKERPVILAFDADTKKSAVRRVRQAKASLSKALISAGIRSRNLALASWSPELGKGVDDVIAAHGIGAWRKIEDDVQTYAQFRVDGIRRVRAANAGLFKLTTPPAVVLDQRYLPNINLPNPGSILAIDSALGTGKTEAI